MRMVGQKKIKKILEQTWGWLGPMFFPLRCPVCDEILSPEESKLGIHASCKTRLIPVVGAVCMHCGRILENSSHEFCQECFKKKYVLNSYDASSASYPFYKNKTKTNITQAKSLYVYRGAIKNTMYRFKYSNRRDYAEFFAKEAKNRYGEWMQKRGIEVIVPVPMYAPKQRKRGYNQATAFAKELSRQTGIPVDEGLVIRVKDTTPQKELDDIERKNNLKSAFQNKKSIVQYSHVLVVDDIYTTGSTVEAVAEELIKIGVRRVYVLSICIGGDM